MKIVVLDGYTLNPGDLSWAGFEALGDLTVYDRTPKNLIIERSQAADILITNKTPIGENELAQLPNLKYIGIFATGYNIVDVEAAAKRNIPVSNIPGYSTKSVAQMTFSLILELYNNVGIHSEKVRNGKWAENSDFCFWSKPLYELDGKTLGVIGFGNIGQEVANIASAFGMNILAYSRTKSDQSHRNNFKWAELDELFKNSDVISLHCPLFPETRGIINKNSLKLMKSTAFIINTSRGPLIVDEDLSEALNKGEIAGAGLDVMSQEPPSANNPLLTAKNCFITPHIAWATKEARTRCMNMAIDNLKAFLNGNPQNVVNKI